jgi:hypothetical protein
LNRTPASASNRKTWTWSGWVKLGLVSSLSTLFGTGGTTDSTRLIAQFNSTGTLNIDVYTVNLRVSNAVFRDPSAWYHIVIVFDSTNATATNRLRAYSNNVELTWSTNNAITLNADYGINNNTSHAIGYDITNTGRYFDGEMTEVNFIDGQALTPSSFGSTNALTGVWQPARYTGTYGTNGFYLPFTDNSALTTASNVGLGKDFSGNGNYWVTNNISITAGATYDSMTDVPTLTSATAANFAVLNPVALASATTSITEGNLKTTGNSVSVSNNVFSTIPMASSKWYAEFVCSVVSNSPQIGIVDISLDFNANVNMYSTKGACYIPNGQIRSEAGLLVSGTSWTTNDVIGVAYDATNNRLYFAKNNTWQNSADPAAGTGYVSPGTPLTSYCFGVNPYNNASAQANFGQRPFTYTAPTGFVALNTYNLPDSTIVKGNTVFDATLYTGTGASLSVTNAASFKPDLVWVKSRSAATDNKLTDSVRGVTKGLISNTTGAETTDTNGLTAFNSNGWTLGTDTTYNNSGATYVGWQWQAGQGSSSSNTNGSITSTVSVNASAGFSVVTYTGTGANATVGHGLGVAPQLVITKGRDLVGGVTNWTVYHISIGNTGALFLNLTNATNTSITQWNNTSPTSSVFSIGTSGDKNTNTGTYVAYCWTPIAGYSAFGSYTGNGSADGPFVYTGFRPKFILIKNTGYDNNQTWVINDTTRSTYNVDNITLRPNSSNAESTTNGSDLDELSNGFKIRNSNTVTNASGTTIIYAAFAENPFKNSLAR